VLNKLPWIGRGSSVSSYECINRCSGCINGIIKLSKQLKTPHEGLWSTDLA